MAPAYGDKLARFVYLDEAGTGGEPWLVVGGVIVHGDHQLDNLYEALREILEKHLPAEKRDELVLHTCDIYGGNGPVFDKDRHPEWTWDKRAAILADLAQLPLKLNLWVTSGWIEMARFPAFSDPPGNKVLEAHVTAYAICLTEVDHWLRQNRRRENCLIIVEDNKSAKQHLKEMQVAYQDPKLTESLAERHRVLFPFKRIREDPAFQEKRPSHPLILADFIAFVTKRFKMNDPRIAPFFEPLKRRHAALDVKLLQRERG